MALELYELIRYFKCVQLRSSPRPQLTDETYPFPFCRRFPNDFKPYQIAVVLAVLIDIATVISVMAAVWLYSIVGPVSSSRRERPLTCLPFAVQTNWGDAIYATVSSSCLKMFLRVGRLILFS